MQISDKGDPDLYAIINDSGGSNVFGQADPPSEIFVAAAAGYYHVCGITVDSEVLCWGYDDQGQASVPEF